MTSISNLTCWFGCTFLCVCSFILLLVNRLFSYNCLWDAKPWNRHWHAKHYCILIVFTLITVDVRKLNQILTRWCLTSPVPLNTPTTKVIYWKCMLQTHHKFLRSSKVCLRSFLTNIDSCCLRRYALLGRALLFLYIKRYYIWALEGIVFIDYLVSSSRGLVDFKILNLHAVTHILAIHEQNVRAPLDICSFVIICVKLTSFPHWLAISNTLFV